MDAAVIVAFSEILKGSIAVYASILRQNGVTEDQIDLMFTEALSLLRANDPGKIPDPV